MLANTDGGCLRYCPELREWLDAQVLRDAVAGVFLCRITPSLYPWRAIILLYSQPTALSASTRLLATHPLLLNNHVCLD